MRSYRVVFYLHQGCYVFQKQANEQLIRFGGGLGFPPLVNKCFLSQQLN